MNAKTREIAQREWDRRPEEESRWYTRYLTFQNLGPNRTLAAAEARSSGKPEGRSPSGAWKRAASAFSWSKRAVAWDLHIAERETESMEELRRRQHLVALKVSVGFVEMVERYVATEDQETLAKIEALAGKGKAISLVQEILNAIAAEDGRSKGIGCEKAKVKTILFETEGVIGDEPDELQAPSLAIDPITEVLGLKFVDFFEDGIGGAAKQQPQAKVIALQTEVSQ